MKLEGLLWKFQPKGTLLVRASQIYAQRNDRGAWWWVNGVHNTPQTIEEAELAPA
jgi:hypothetical protein